MRFMGWHVPCGPGGMNILQHIVRLGLAPAIVVLVAACGGGLETAGASADGPVTASAAPNADAAPDRTLTQAPQPMPVVVAPSTAPALAPAAAAPLTVAPIVAVSVAPAVAPLAGAVVVAAAAPAPAIAAQATATAGAPVDTVALTIVRFDGGQGAVTVSNAVPLIPGMLMPQALGQVHLLVNGLEVPAYVQAVGHPRKDGSVRSLLVQFQVPALASTASLVGGLKLGGATRSAANTLAKQPTPSLVVAAALPSDVVYLAQTRIAGPLIPKASVPKVPAFLEQMNNDFEFFAEPIYNKYKLAAYRDSATYDHVVTHYQQWLRTADPKWFGIANQLGHNFYTTGAATKASPLGQVLEGMFAEWNNETQNMALHYLLTGNDAVRITLNGMVTWWFSWQDQGMGLGTASFDKESGDHRITARIIQATATSPTARPIEAGSIQSPTSAFRRMTFRRSSPACRAASPSCSMPTAASTAHPRPGSGRRSRASKSA
jgi:hypothetical protein